MTPLLPAPEPQLLLPAPEPRWKRWAKPATAIALAAFLLVAFAIGWFIHHHRSAAAEQAQADEANALDIASVVVVRRSPPVSSVLLPGSLAPIAEASIYARASGYVRKRFVDIGDRVRAGQLLAEIDAPELDLAVAQGVAAVGQARQQANVARASVGDAKAKLELARVTVLRYETLLAQDSIAAQDVDQRRQEYASALAALASAEANVGAADENLRAAIANAARLQALRAFKRVRAPFAGVVTARNVDEGALVGSAGGQSAGSAGTASPQGSPATTQPGSGSATSTLSSSSQSGSTSGGGTGGGSSQELFRVAQVDRLRVYVSVPQENATAVATGSPATVYVQEYADRFKGRIARTARAIDTTSRTLLTEVQIDNADGRLLPGMYAQVRLESPRSDPPLLVPGEAVVVQPDGLRVATLAPLSDEQRQRLPRAEDRNCARAVRLLPVATGRDYGTEVEVTRGLGGGEVLIANPGDETGDGAVVLPELQQPQAQAQRPGGGASKPQGKSDKEGQAGKEGKEGKEGKGKQSGKDGEGGKQADNAARQRRQRLQQTCIEQQVQQLQQAHGPAAASAPAPAGQSASAIPGGPSDREPAAIQSPSIKAPTQGRPGR